MASSIGSMMRIRTNASLGLLLVAIWSVVGTAQVEPPPRVRLVPRNEAARASTPTPSAQRFGDPLFLAVVRLDGILVPLAIHNGAEWWGGWPVWPVGLKDDQVRVPTSVSAVPRNWMPPGLTVPPRWTLWPNAGAVRSIQVRNVTLGGSVMSMVGLRTDFSMDRSVAADDDEAGIAVVGRADIGRVMKLDATSADWQSLWREIRADFDVAETEAIARWYKALQ